jgi:hypothetical protein
LTSFMRRNEGCDIFGDFVFHVTTKKCVHELYYEMDYMMKYSSWNLETLIHLYRIRVVFKEIVIVISESGF